MHAVVTTNSRTRTFMASTTAGQRPRFREAVIALEFARRRASRREPSLEIGAHELARITPLTRRR